MWASEDRPSEIEVGLSQLWPSDQLAAFVHSDIKVVKYNFSIEAIVASKAVLFYALAVVSTWRTFSLAHNPDLDTKIVSFPHSDRFARYV